MSTLNELRAIDTALRDTLEDCNDTMLGIPAETFKELPQRIGETISSATNNGYNTGFEAGFASGEQGGVEIGVGMGKQAAYDEFWDTFQNYGKPRLYDNAFRGGYWNTETFKPKYPLVPTSAQYMFYSTKTIPILPCEIDTSQCGNMSYSFSNTGFIELPIIDLRGVSPSARTVSVFGSSRQLVRIEKVYLNGGNLEATFDQVEALQEIRCEGEFVTSTNFQWSPLSVASMKSIISCLKNFTGTDKEFAYTLTFSDECWAALEADSTAPDGGTWQEYVFSLGWNA